MKTAHRTASRAKRKVWPLLNPILHAMAGAAKLTPAQVEQLMAPNHAAVQAVQALQFGGFNDHHWRVCADMFNIAEALARPPVNIANDHAEKFEEAQCVLYALSEQFRDKATWTPRSAQLQVVKDAMFIFQIQLEHVGQGEFELVVEKLTRRMSEALRGNGGKVQLVEALS